MILQAYNWVRYCLMLEKLEAMLSPSFYFSFFKWTLYSNHNWLFLKGKYIILFSVA